MSNKKRLFFKAITDIYGSLLEVLLHETLICESLRNELIIKFYQLENALASS